jgi:hypothetical protein
MKKLSSMLLALAVLAAAGCAGEIGPPTVAPTVDITGRWVGRWVAVNSLGPSAAVGRLRRSGTIQMTLTQTGSQYSGNLLVPGDPTASGPTQGVVSGNQVRVLQPTSLTGSLTVQGDTMSGELAVGWWSHVFGSTEQYVIVATLTRRSSDQEEHGT